MGCSRNSQVLSPLQEQQQQQQQQQQDVPRKSLAMKHRTSANVLVDVFQTDYSNVVRSYRVCCRDPLRLHMPPILQSVTLNDMVLLGIFITLVLPSLPVFFETFFLDGSAPLSSNLGSGSSSRLSISLRSILLVVCFVVLVWHLVARVRRVHVEEVTAIRGLGMQLTSYNMFGRILTQRFFDLKLIRSLIIYDAYFRCSVIFFLSAAVENSAERVVLFEETLPRLAVLQPILCGLRHILFEEPETGLTLAEMEALGSDRLGYSGVCDYKGDRDDSDVIECYYGTPLARPPAQHVELQGRREDDIDVEEEVEVR